MDFSLSEICSLLADRIEDYKTVAKKRRIQRGIASIKSKMPKLNTVQSPSNFQNDDTQLFASTPKSMMKKYSPLPVSFSSVIKSSPLITPKRRQACKEIIKNPRRLNFAEAEE